MPSNTPHYSILYSSIDSLSTDNSRIGQPTAVLQQSDARFLSCSSLFHGYMVSITSAWAMPGTLMPSLKLVLLSNAPVGMKSTFFQLPSSSCFRI